MHIRSQIIDQCRRIGRLTAIDGAMVMTYDRYIHCFGAKIQAVDSLAGSDELRVMMFTGLAPDLREGTEDKAAASSLPGLITSSYCYYCNYFYTI